MRPVKNLREAKERLEDIYRVFITMGKPADVIVHCYTPTWSSTEMDIQRYKRIVARIIKAKLNDVNDDLNVEKDCFIIWVTLFGEENDCK